MLFTIQNLRIARIEVQEGVSKKTGNNWKKLNVTFREEVNGYASQIIADVFGQEDVDNFLRENREGNMVDVQFRCGTQEYNGRTYNNISVLHCMKAGGQSPQQGGVAPKPQFQPQPSSGTGFNPAGSMPSSELDPSKHDDDLPF